MAPIDRIPYMALLQDSLGLRDPRDNEWKETPDSIARSKAVQRRERFAVVLPELRKDSREGLKLLMAVYEDATDVLILYDMLSDIHGPATCSRHLNTILQERSK